MKKLLALTLALTATLSAAAPVRKLVVAYAPKDTLSFKLIAAYDRARGWRGANEVEGAVGTRMYNIVGLAGIMGQVEGSQPRPRGEDGVVGRMPRKLYKDTILLNGDRPDLCQVTTAQSDDDSAQKAVTAFLRSRGVETERTRFFQNLVVDLDGDGKQEGLIVAGQREPYGDQKKPGEYSLVAVIQNGEVSPLQFQSAKEQADSPWEDYEVMLVGNLDGQGTAEIILRYRYYEGGGVIIMGREKGSWKAVGRADWGL